MNRSSRGWQFAAGAVVLVVLAVVGWLALADDDEPSRKARSAPVASTPAGPDRDAWRADFSAEQVEAFDAALADHKRFGELMQPFEEEPADVDQVRPIFERYSMNPADDLASYVATFVDGGMRIIVPPEPLYVTGRSIDVNDKGGVVEFDQCTDYSVADVRRDGKAYEGARPTSNETAILRIRMISSTGEGSRGVWQSMSAKVVDEPCR